MVMDKNELIEKIMNMDEEMLHDLEDELDNELSKPEDDWNEQTIIELTRAIAEIKGISLTDDVLKKGEKAILDNTDTKAHHKRRIIRKLAPAAACAALLFGLNQASLNAYGENVFKRAYHFTKGGVSIMIGENDNTESTEPPTAPPATDASAPEEEVIELPTYPGDPYGIKALCAKSEIFPITPTYIPDGFKLMNLIQSDDSHTTNVQFTYQNKDKRIIIGYIYCKSDAGSIAIPADTPIQYEINVGSIPFSIIKEDGQYKALCLNDKLFYTVQTYGIEYDEAERILCSFS